MNRENVKKKFTKRRVLIIVNAVFFILVCLSCLISIFAVDLSSIFELLLIIISYISSQFTFTALSLVVYYLAIMAGALNKKYKEEVEESNENKK